MYMDNKGLIVIIVGIVLNVITYRVTQNDDDKSRRYITLSIVTIATLIGFYLMVPGELNIEEKISLEEIKSKVKLFSQTS